eukprot:52512-Eustigmatos_ZCMA.PRE.1
MSPELDRALWSSCGGVMQIPVTKWTGFRSTLPASQTSFQSLISLSVKSLKTLLWGYTQTGQYDTS